MQGYVMLLMKDHPDANCNGYVCEHRWVMEQHLGRRLVKTEDVHHKDGNRQNNHIDNLLLIDKPTHGRMEALKRWRR
jgi:uncharacterized protein (DUF1330 family)